MNTNFDAVMVGHDAFHLPSSTFLRTEAKNFYTVAEKCANCKLWCNVYIYTFRKAHHRTTASIP